MMNSVSGLWTLTAPQVPEVHVKDSNSKKHNSPDLKAAGDVIKSEVCVSRVLHVTYILRIFLSVECTRKNSLTVMIWIRKTVCLLSVLTIDETRVCLLHA